LSDEIQRLLDGALDPRVRGALEAARTDGPSAAHLRRAAQALGLPAAIAGQARAAGAAGGAKAASSTVTSLLKWTGTASIIGGALVGVFVAWPSRSGTDASAVAPAAHGGLPQVTSSTSPLPDTRRAEPRAVVSKPVSAPVPALAGSPALPSAVSVPVSAVAPKAASPLARTGDGERTHATPTAAPSRHDIEAGDHPSASTALAHSVAFDDAPAAQAVATVDTLREETALLDAARRAMQAGNAAGAIALLDRYDASPSLRALASEALLLRARALAKAGYRAKACAAARLYVEKHGTDGYAGELERSCLGAGRRHGASN
jgi:hypothetical protein